MTEQFDKTSFNGHERHRPHERTTTAGSWSRQTRGNGLGVPRLLVILAMALAIAPSSWLAPYQASSGGVVQLSEGRAIDEQAEQREGQNARPTPTNYVDTNGKRIGPDEPYVAQRTLSDGKTIIYRQNKRDIEALVKALKQDGVTDKRLLDPKAWLMWYCPTRQLGGCAGKCGVYRCTDHMLSDYNNDPTRAAAPSKPILAYCGCGG